MTFECEHCGKTSTTEAGLALHMKVYHKDETKPVVTKVETPKKKTKKKSSKNLEDSAVIDLAKINKEKLENYEKVKKKFKQKPTGVEHNATVKKAQIKKIFPEGMKTRMIGANVPKAVHEHLEASYTAIVLTSKNGWKRVRLVGKTTMITWAEGDYKKGYKVTYPNLGKR